MKQWWAIDWTYSKRGSAKTSAGLRLYVAEEVKRKKRTDIEWVDYGRVSWQQRGRLAGLAARFGSC